MGIYQYSDPQTGKSYDFEIAGDVPTDSDFASMAQFLEQERDAFEQEFEEFYGRAPEEVDDGTAIGRGLSRGVQRFKGAFGETIGTIGEETGLGFLENYGEGVEERAQQRLGALSLEQPKAMQSTDVEDVGSAFRYAGEVVGEQLPQLGLGIGAAAALPAALGVTGLTALGVGAAAAGTVTAPILFGNNIQRQEDEVAAGKKASVDVGAALTATFGQATLEGLADRILIGKLFRPIVGKNIFTRTTSRVGGGATTEGLTEIGQQLLERAQAGLPIDSEDAIAEYREAGIAGGIIGGGTRATLGAIGERAPVAKTDDTTVDQVDDVMQDAQTGTGVSVTAAEETELKNAIDPTPPKGNAEQTSDERAVATNAVAEEASKEKEIERKEKVNFIGQQERAVSDAEQKAINKTKSLFPSVTTKEDRAASKKREQTNQQIEVKSFKDVDAEARQALVDDPNLLKRDEDFIREELDAVYSPEVIDAIILQKRAITGDTTNVEETTDVDDNIITKEFLTDQLGVQEYAHIVRGKQRSVVGLDKNDPKVRKELQAYVNAGGDAKDAVQSFLDTLEVEDARGDSTTTGGTGAGVQDSGSGVAGAEGTGSGDQDPFDATSSDAKGVGTDLSDTESSDVATGEQSDTLADSKERNRATARRLVDAANARKIEEAPRRSGIGVGEASGAAGQVIPGVTRFKDSDRVLSAQQDRFAPPPAAVEESVPESQAYQNVTQAIDEVRGEAAQTEAQQALDDYFFAKQKSTIEGNILKKARIFHEQEGKALFETQEADTTTVGDKQAILKLLTKRGKNSREEQAAVDFFNKYRRPDVALEQIGATSRVGFGKNEVAIKDIKTNEDAFYSNQTKPRAILARAWIEANLSPEANRIVKASAELYGRDTSRSIQSDKQIVDNKEKDFDKLKKKTQVQDLNELSDDKALLDDDIEFADDSIADVDLDNLKYLVDPIHGLDTMLLPTTINGLRNNDLNAALLSIAATNPVPRVRDIAKRFVDVVGTTQVQVVDNLSQLVGRRAAGMFEPETNTIYLDANTGMNVHAVLHEMTHAATSASLANPSLPEVKQLQTLLDAVREQFGEVYGTANLDEFVAESLSNPEFQSALALMKVDGGKTTGIRKLYDAILRGIRKRLGLSPSPNTLSEVDKIVEGLISPSPETRAAPRMLLKAGTQEGSLELAKSMVTSAPTSKPSEYAQKVGDFVFDRADTGMQGAKNVVLNSLDSRILTDIAKDRIPYAPDLNILIRQMSGEQRSGNDALESILSEFAAWKRKNTKQSAILNNLMPRSTFLRVDPSLPRNTYDGDAERLLQWDELNSQYRDIGREGQAFYRQMRNFFTDMYAKIEPALKARLEATISDDTVRATAFEKLRGILAKESGVITPYFPLQRKGKHRLQYTALNENGQPDAFVEYYQSRRELERAYKIAEQMSVGGTKPTYSRADQPMDFTRVPSTSFIYNILQVMELSKDGFSTPESYRQATQSIVDLALDSMPERSFMQGFRKRGDKDNPLGYRGFIGDTTPTGAGGVEFDAYTMLKEKGRDLNRQVVQLKYSAELQKFRNKLVEDGYLGNPETADIARTMDKIASFAQKPNVPRWSQAANAVGFNMTMGLNFSSAAITFFDVGMSAMPIIAAEHGITKTAAAYGTAAKLFAKAPRERNVLVTGPDGDPVEQKVRMGIAGKSAANYVLERLPQPMKDLGLGRAIKRGMDQGQFNQSITQESLEVSRDAPFEGINKWSSAMFHHAERFNRETTFIASYILEAQKILDTKGQLTEADIDAAAQKAIETTEFTLGSTAAAGRPVWAQSGVGNILFLFKRFAIAKYYMMYKLGHESIGTTNISKIMKEMNVSEAEAQEIATQRKIARRGLRNFLVSTGLMAGAGGMPMMGAFGAIYNMFAEDDEDDFEAVLRKSVGEGIYGGLANELLGLDISNRIAMNSLLYRAPIIEKDQSPLWTLVEQLGGPVIGVTNSALRGGSDMYYGIVESDSSTLRRGFESFTPASIRNISKGLRFYTEGATTRRGDPITEDINAYNAIMQGAGFAPQAYIQQLEFNKNNRRRQEAINSKRSKLLRRRNMALREGDTEEVAKVMRMIKEYNASLPTGARKSIITSDTLKNSFSTFNRTTSKMRGGITYTQFMDQILGEYDRGFQLF